MEGSGVSQLYSREGSVVSQLYSALAHMPLLRAKSKGKGMMAWQVCLLGTH